MFGSNAIYYLIYRTLKDARRRVVETVLEKAGVAERTGDEVFDTHVARFDSLVKDMNECGAALTASLAGQKSFFIDMTEFSKIMDRVFAQNANPEYWPNSTCVMTQSTSAAAYLEAMTTIHEIYRYQDFDTNIRVIYICTRKI